MPPSAAMREAITRFLAAALEGAPPDEAGLSSCLDTLAVAYHQTPEGDPAEDDRTPPSRDYQQIYRHIGDRFPDLGYYGVADPLSLSPEGWVMGDAIDDLADIVSDLEETLWRLETLGEADACWHFRFSYKIHWGMHLRELQLYLQARLRAG